MTHMTHSAMKMKRKEPQLQQVEAQIAGLQNRIKYSQVNILHIHVHVYYTRLTLTLLD